MEGWQTFKHKFNIYLLVSGSTKKESRRDCDVVDTWWRRTVGDTILSTLTSKARQHRYRR